MKPIKLIISGFGPYGDTMPEINFEQFAGKGLFLISGDTGAGKTSIFDAICFALFGTTSTTYRDTKNLRSEYAKDETKSFVDFYFSHQGKNYHIYRQPYYERKKQRGKGLTTVKENAVFYQEGAVPVEGLNQVKDAVNELLHIDDKQFKQIAMIAQGEFWNLLNAKTEQRTEILRTIFDTGCYKNIEYKLKEEKDKSFGRRITAQNSIIQYFNDVQADQADEAGMEMEDLKKKTKAAGNLWNVQEMLSCVEELLSLDECRLNQETKELALLEKEWRKNQDALATAQENNKCMELLEELALEKRSLEEKKKEMEEAQILLEKQKAAKWEVYPVFQALEKKKKEGKGTKEEIRIKREELEFATEALNQAKARWEESQKEQPKAEKLKWKREKITEEIPKYRQREEWSKQLVALEKEESEAEMGIARWQEKERKQNEKIIFLKEKVEFLKDKPKELGNWKSLEEKWRALAGKMEEILKNQLPYYQRLCRELKKNQESYQLARQNYDQAEESRRHGERILENCRAGLLAQHLVEGEKCPVCGSLHHPQPAILLEESVTEEEVKFLKEEAEKLLEKKDNAFREAEKSKAAKEQYEIQLKNSMLHCLADEGNKEALQPKDFQPLAEALGGAYLRVQEKQKETAEGIISLEQDCSQLENARKQLDKAQGSEREALIFEKEELGQLQSRLQKEIAAVKAKLEGFRQLSHKDLKEAEAERKTIGEELERITKRIEEAEKKKKAADLKVTGLAATLQTLEKTLEEQAGDETELRKELHQALALKKFAAWEEMLDYVVSEEELAASEEKINHYKQEVATNQIRYVQAKTDAAGKSKIDIETLKEKCTTEENRVKSKQKTVNEVENRIRNNREKQSRIQVQKQKYENAAKENDICSRLYDLVRGNTGQGKITLEQYIQAAGFDGIIAAANRRLLPMSEGQYELYRQEGALGKKSNHFLDLEVLDNYTGHRRPVGNLSGGESFQASLSLALGLSDTVSSNLGGIQMDALFIDEGFGTLDRKSIDNAMEILLNLSGTDKLVGVISHREELMENIPQQIQVKKTKMGSKFSIELGL